MAIWLTRKRKLKGEGDISTEVVLKGRILIANRIKTEFAYFKLTNNLDRFIEIWALNNVLCTVDDENELELQ